MLEACISGHDSQLLEICEKGSEEDCQCYGRNIHMNCMLKVCNWETQPSLNCLEDMMGYDQVCEGSKYYGQYREGSEDEKVHDDPEDDTRGREEETPVSSPPAPTCSEEALSTTSSCMQSQKYESCLGSKWEEAQKVCTDNWESADCACYMTNIEIDCGLKYCSGTRSVTCLAQLLEYDQVCAGSQYNGKHSGERETTGSVEFGNEDFGSGNNTAIETCFDSAIQLSSCYVDNAQAIIDCVNVPPPQDCITAPQSKDCLCFHATKTFQCQADSCSDVSDVSCMKDLLSYESICEGSKYYIQTSPTLTLTGSISLSAVAFSLFFY